MANFDTSAAKRNSVRDANNLLDLIRDVYQSGKQVQTLLALYQTNSDPAFTAAINALYTASERQELAAMLTPLNSLINDWTTNHASAVGA